MNHLRHGGRGRAAVLGALWMLAASATAAHGSDQDEPACDASLAVALRNDRDATLLLAKPFKAGEPVALGNSPANPPTAPVDLCLVKLVVGPGHAGSAGAPSTSKGIGIEVWLPARESWNGIIRSFGSGGWAGGTHTDVTRIGRTGAADTVQLGAIAKGYAISSSDHGHAGNLAIGTNRDASFALREDGTINTTLWHDFAERSMHEMARLLRKPGHPGGRFVAAFAKPRGMVCGQRQNRRGIVCGRGG